MQATAGVHRSCSERCASCLLLWPCIILKWCPNFCSSILGHKVLLLVSSWGTKSSCWCHPGAQSPPAGVILGHKVLLLVSSWGTKSSCWCHPEVEVPRQLCSLPRSSTDTDSDTNNIIICMLGGQTVHVCPHIAIDRPKFLYSPK